MHAGRHWPLQYTIKHYSQNTLRSLAGWGPVAQAWGLAQDDVIGLEASGGASGSLQLRLVSVASKEPGHGGQGAEVEDEAAWGSEVVVAADVHAGRPPMYLHMWGLRSAGPG